MGTSLVTVRLKDWPGKWAIWHVSTGCLSCVQSQAVLGSSSWSPTSEVTSDMKFTDAVIVISNERRRRRRSRRRVLRRERKRRRRIRRRIRRRRRRRNWKRGRNRKNSRNLELIRCPLHGRPVCLTQSSPFDAILIDRRRCSTVWEMHVSPAWWSTLIRQYAAKMQNVQLWWIQQLNPYSNAQYTSPLLNDLYSKQLCLSVGDICLYHRYIVHIISYLCEMNTLLFINTW